MNALMHMLAPVANLDQPTVRDHGLQLLSAPRRYYVSAAFNDRLQARRARGLERAIIRGRSTSNLEAPLMRGPLCGSARVSQ
jgi:hypothetical protein